MYLIDLPYVSEFLAQTIEQNDNEIVETAIAKKLLAGKNLNWISEEEAKKKILEKDTLIYTNSENNIGWLKNHLGEVGLNNQVSFLKDKVKFRELLKSVYPNFYFEKLSLENFQEFSFEEIKLPCVIKPSVGFFSIGVQIITDEESFNRAKVELSSEKLINSYPQEVVNTSSLIIEEYIEGDEFAIDSYADKDGNIIILSILEHKFKSVDDTSDRLYTTSVELIKKYEKVVIEFLTPIVEQLKLKSFPFHTEIRINSEGEIVPIEINPLRFGGWCTTADLNWYAYRINSYKYFINQLMPNWGQVLDAGNDKNYSLVILDNSIGYDKSEIQSFDYEQLIKDYKGILELRRLDIQHYPVFGFMFIETAKGDTYILDKLLNTDFKEYIRLK